MGNKIAELEKRISELEEELKNMMIYSDGANVSFNNSNINMLQILGDGANVALENVHMSDSLHALIYYMGDGE